MDIKRELGSKIKRIRHKKGITQEKLAEQVNISTYTLIGIENGKNFMTAQTMQKIIDCLDITLEELFNAEHLKPTNELVEDIHDIVNSVKNDRDKVEEIYKILKAITSY